MAVVSGRAGVGLAVVDPWECRTVTLLPTKSKPVIDLLLSAAMTRERPTFMVTQGKCRRAPERMAAKIGKARGVPLLDPPAKEALRVYEARIAALYPEIPVGQISGPVLQALVLATAALHTLPLRPSPGHPHGTTQSTTENNGDAATSRTGVASGRSAR